MLRRMKHLLLAVAVLLAPCAIAPYAAAHAILEQSQPGNGTTVAAGDVMVTLTYNSRIDATRSALTLTMPDQTKTRLAITPGAAPNVLTSSAHLSPGKYVLHWQVLSVDGHITRGQVSFTVQGL